MNRRQCFATSIIVLGLLICAGCRADRGPGLQERPAATQPVVPGEDREKPSVKNGKVYLATALLPHKQAQPVTIRLFEERETVGPTSGKVTHELNLEIRGTLLADKSEPDGTVLATLGFERIILIMKVPGQPGTTLGYNSASDRLKAGNPLADMMSTVADAKLSLRVSPAGRLLDLRGLDAKWRAANLLMAPPGLLFAQWLFRDAAMAELVSEALFPPMPAEPLALGESWQVDVPANIPLVAQLNSHRRCTLAVSADGSNRLQALGIRGNGVIQPASSEIGSPPPAIRPVIEQGTEEISQLLDPATGALEQSNERLIKATLKLTPPEGNEREEMSLKQLRTLQATRGNRLTAGK